MSQRQATSHISARLAFLKLAFLSTFIVMEVISDKGGSATVYRVA